MSGLKTFPRKRFLVKKFISPMTSLKTPVIEINRTYRKSLKFTFMISLLVFVVLFQAIPKKMQLGSGVPDAEQIDLIAEDITPRTQQLTQVQPPPRPARAPRSHHRRRHVQCRHRVSPHRCKSVSPPCDLRRKPGVNRMPAHTRTYACRHPATKVGRADIRRLGANAVRPAPHAGGRGTPRTRSTATRKAVEASRSAPPGQTHRRGPGKARGQAAGAWSPQQWGVAAPKGGPRTPTGSAVLT